MLEKKHFYLLIILFVIFTPASLLACVEDSMGVKTNLDLPHLLEKATIDGILSEDVWRKSLVVSLDYETSPGENTPPPVETKVYLYENGETLFIAFDARDHKPEEIRDYLLDRDNIWSSDFVGIKFDTFGESRKAYQFFANTRGIQGDAIQEDFRGDDSTWDAIWTSAGKVTQTGYIVEMAIPFQALRFPASKQKQFWGIEILRFYPRNKFHRIANTPVDRSISCQICQFDKISGLENIKESKNLRLIPTLVAGRSRSRDLEAQTPWKSEKTDTSPGLDLRWGITEEIYLNATLHPDFSQVEANNAQLNINDSFSIFLDEKRPFFLDGADYFNTSNQLVHTKNIIEPDYGIKVTGQSNGHSYGAIVANDNHTSFLLPSSQSSTLLQFKGSESKNQILRYQSDLGNKNTIGLLATYKSADQYSNQIASIDGKYWFTENHSLSYQAMYSETHHSDEMLFSEYLINDSGEQLITDRTISDTAYTLDYNYETRDWKASAQHRDFGENFRSDLGFIQRVDFKKTILGAERTWYPAKEEYWWNKISFGGDWDQTDDQSGQKLEEEIEGIIKVQGIYRSELSFKFGERERFWGQEYFDETFYSFTGNVEPSAGLKFNANIQWGDTIDIDNSALGESLRISPEIDWQISQNLRSSVSYSRLIFDIDKGELFKASVMNIRLSYLFNERSSIRYTLQKLNILRNPHLYDSFFNNDPLDDEEKTSNSMASQLLYTYRISPQTLFFAGYSESGFQDDSLSNIKKDFKNIFLKFSYAWQI